MKKAGAVLIVIATLFIVVQRANAGQIIHAQSDSLKLSTVLQSHMVVQQNKPFKIWGTAAPDAKVTIKPDWMKSAIHIEADAQGRFMGIVDVPVAKKGDYGTHEILVSSNRQQILLNDLLIGDLWFLSGQSNMQFAVHEMIDSTAIIAAANNPHIRLLNVALNFSKEPVNYIKGKWKQCSSANVRDFSAVGYSFGARLQRELDIPIGLIFSGIGASGVQAYVPKEVLANDSLLNRVYLEPYLKDPKSEKPVNAG
ncbi:MAG TPA: sialate O-acetylesterase, partial [Arachidicoccus sp.]|nr:sialate O-acetylesterase [Arachidicoccus sp.]